MPQKYNQLIAEMICNKCKKVDFIYSASKVIIQMIRHSELDIQILLINQFINKKIIKRLIFNLKGIESILFIILLYLVLSQILEISRNKSYNHFIQLKSVISFHLPKHKEASLSLKDKIQNFILKRFFEMEEINKEEFI